MVDRGGLENRCARKGTGGSNPSSSASLRLPAKTVEQKPMGIYDRDYMKAPPEQKRLRQQPASFWQRLRFKLWLLFKDTKKSGPR